MLQPIVPQSWPATKKKTPHSTSCDKFSFALSSFIYSLQVDHLKAGSRFASATRAQNSGTRMAFKVFFVCRCVLLSQGHQAFFLPSGHVQSIVGGWPTRGQITGEQRGGGGPYGGTALLSYVTCLFSCLWCGNFGNLCRGLFLASWLIVKWKSEAVDIFEMGSRLNGNNLKINFNSIFFLTHFFLVLGLG